MNDPVKGFLHPPLGDLGLDRAPAVRHWRACLIPLVILECLSRAGVATAQTWTSRGPEGGAIQSLAIDPQTPTTLYAGTAGGGVFTSTDGGGSWSAINTGLIRVFGTALAIDPLMPTTLVGTGSGVFRSTNAGGSWSLSNTGLPTTTHVQALAIDPLIRPPSMRGCNSAACSRARTGAAHGVPSTPA